MAASVPDPPEPPSFPERASRGAVASADAPARAAVPASMGGALPAGGSIAHRRISMRAKLGIAGVLALAVVGIGWYVWSVRAMDEAKKRAHARLQVPSAPTVEGASTLAPPGAPPTGSAIGAKPTAANDPRSQADRAAAAACRCLNDNTEGAVIRATCVQELRENPSPVSTLCLRAFVDDPESEKLLVGMKSEDPTPEQEIILDAHNALMAKGRELKTLRSIGAAPPGPPPAGPPQDSPKLKPPPPSPD